MAVPGTEIDHQDQPRPPLTPGRILFRIVAGLVVAASFGVWVYAYSGLADREAPDLLGDEGLRASAESVCAAALADVDALPDALVARDGVERGEQIRAATARFEMMVGDLASLPSEPGRDRQIYTAWLDDWRVLLGDRLAYADRLATGEDAEFLITDTGVGERLDRRITRFANTNLMTSCVAPTDV